MTKTWKPGTFLIRRIAHRFGRAGQRTRAKLISKTMYGLMFCNINKENMQKLKSSLKNAKRCITGLKQNVKIEELHKYVPFESLEEVQKTQLQLKFLSES